ncbi:MAG: ATP-binding protein [Saprospiraceae bacterium]
MKHLIFLLFSLFVACPLSGQVHVFSIEEAPDEILLNDYLSVLELGGDSAQLEEVAAGKYNSQFIPYPTFIQKYLPATAGGKVLLDPGKIYWWRLTLQNNLDQPIHDWVLHLGRSCFTEVYVIGEDGSLLSTHYAGWLVPSWEKDNAIGNRQEERISLSIPISSSVVLYGKVKVTNGKEPYLWVRLAQKDFYENWHFIEKTRLDWAFIGFLFTFILINFLLYATTDDRAFLWHGLFQTFLFIYLLEFFNVLSELPWLRDHRIALQVVIYSTLCLMDVAYIQFIRRYMRMKIIYPFWDRYFSWFEVVRVLFAVGIVSYYLATVNMKMSDNMTAIFMVGQYSLMAILLTWLFVKKDKKSLFLIAGTAVFVVGVVLNAISVMQGAGIQFSYTQFGVAGELILFTLGLGYRMKILQTEEQEALRLKDLDDFKTRFYTNITHEFRTPLTVITGISEMGKLEIEKSGLKTLEPRIFQFLISNFDITTRNANQLLRLINRLLDLSKVQSGKMALQKQRGDVAGFIRYVVESFQSYANTRDIQLRHLSELDHFDMDFDAEKLQDVLSNLLSNAFKFSLPGCKVLVITKAVPPNGTDGEHLQIIVKDNGSGIPPEALPHIFDRYFTTKDTGNPAGGFGIGLALVKELVQLMGGRITVKSEPGHGAEFRVNLPVTREATPMEQAGMKDLSQKPKMEATLPSTHIVPVDGEEKPVCLVIDDNIDVVRYLQNLLEQEYQVMTAYNGKLGVEKAVDQLPDVIISDVMMPEMDGLELCDFLKNDERTSHIPIILLTAKTSVQDRLEGLRRGADAYLAKPFNQEELFICLKRSVELRNRLKDRFASLPTGAPVASEPDLAMEDAFLQKARNAVEEHLADDEFGIHQLCRMLTMSRAQLHRKLTALTDKSASHFIRSIRLQRAKELLATTDLTIAEIAYEVGFRDPNYFTRTFAEEFGVAPSETRK